MEVITLREDYFCCNTYIVVKNNECIIFDAGVSLNTLKSAIQKYNIEKVKGIFLTHAHFDHFLALEDYIQEFSCPVYIHSKGIVNLCDPINNYSQFTEKIISIKSDKIHKLPSSKVVNIDPFCITYIYTPGHTDDSVCYMVEDVMFTGDTVFDGVYGRTDLANSNTEDMYKSLLLLKNMKNFQMYFPGHGRKSPNRNMQDFLLSIQ